MSILRAYHKTPVKNINENVYEIEEINDVIIKNFIQSKFSSEGLFGIEIFKDKDYQENYSITPSFHKIKGLIPTEKNWSFKNENIKDMSIYELSLEKPTFLPLDINQQLNLLKFINEINDSNLFIQLLICKRDDNWRDVAFSQYEEYLKGNDHPFEMKVIRSFQSKAINILNSIANFKSQRQPITEIEDKLSYDHFRFECRIIIFNKKSEEVIATFRKELRKISLFNDLSIVKLNNKKEVLKLIEQRQFKTGSQYHLLSDREICSVLCDQSITSSSKIYEQKEPLLDKPINALSTNHLINLLPNIKDSNTEIIDDELVKQIQHAFKRSNITTKQIKVLDILSGKTINKITITTPSDVTYSKVQKNLVNIQSSLGNENIAIEIGEKPDTIDILLPRQKRGVLYLREALESDEFNQFIEEVKLPFIIGENIYGEMLYHCLSELKHILIAGATGSGKSIFLSNLLLSLILYVKPELLNLILIDPKKVELNQFKGFPQVSKFITDMNEAVTVVSSLCTLMDQRYDEFYKVNVRSIDAYNTKTNNNMPYIVCVIEEFADLMSTNSEVEDYVVRLGQKARAAGIHLIIATQRPSVDVVTGLIKTNLPSVVSFMLKTSSDYRTVFGKGIPYKLLGKGDGVAMLEGQVKEFERFQTPIMSLDEAEVENVLKELQEEFKNVKRIELDLPKEETPIERIKKIIATTNETRVSELARLMKLGNNPTHDLIKQLVSEGWLEKQGRSYVIILDEEELNKWRE